MKKLFLSLALLGLLAVVPSASAAEPAMATPDGTPVQTVGVLVPWRGWGVARPYGAPLGYNRGYNYGYRPYYGNYYRPYADYRYSGWYY
jgi:hypothetical protein